MTNNKKQLATKIILISLILLVSLLFSLLMATTNKLNSIKDLSTDTVVSGDLDDYYVVTYKYDEVEKTFFILKTEEEVNLFSFLLTFEMFDQNDFSSFDGINYYFSNTMTDVLELKDDSNYYKTDEWGRFLVVGLQAIYINQNLTIVRSNY